MIREFFRKNPEASSADALAALKRKGIAIGLIYNVKNSINQKNGTVKRRKRNGSNDGDVQGLFAAKAFVDKVGSIEQATHYLKTLAEIRS